MIRTDKDVLGTSYRSFWFKSAFECYTACIKNPVCIFATFRSFANKLEIHPSCLMKTKLDKSLPASDLNMQTNHASEYIEVKG